MSALQTRRTPLEIIRALRAAKLNGIDPALEESCRLALAEALERRQLLTVTGASITPPVGATIGNSAVFTPSATTDHDPAATTWALGFGDGTTYTGTIAGTTTVGHTYAEPGTYSVSGQVTDGTGGYYYCSTTITVADAAISPAGGMNTTDIGAVEGESYGGVVAHFTDGNPDATAADFAGSISFGDGTTISGSIAADLGGGFDVIGSHTFTEDGSYGGYVHITDDYSGSLYMYLNAAITAASITATTGTGTFAEGYSQTVATIPFEDANPYKSASDLSGEIYWGDGTSIAGTIVSEGGGNFEVTGTHMFATAGTFTGSVEVTGTGGVSAGASYTATSVSITSVTASDNGDSGNTIDATDNYGDTLYFTPNDDGTGSIHISDVVAPDNATADAATEFYVIPPGGTPSTASASGTLSSAGSDVALPTISGDAGTFSIEAGTLVSGVFTETQQMPVAPVYTKHLKASPETLSIAHGGSGSTVVTGVDGTGAQIQVGSANYKVFDSTGAQVYPGTFSVSYTSGVGDLGTTTLSISNLSLAAGTYTIKMSVSDGSVEPIKITLTVT